MRQTIVLKPSRNYYVGLNITSLTSKIDCHFFIEDNRVDIFHGSTLRNLKSVFNSLMIDKSIFVNLDTTRIWFVHQFSFNVN